jgi:NAD(P)-dependent dehydrogenase (short-subunit alcohol dehydrogenase family)
MVVPEMRCRFADQTALVTGAASGIGRSTALALAREGATLIVCDVDPDGLQEVRKEIDAITRCVFAERVDVGDREAMRAFADRVHDNVPAVDLLVNNAGVGLAGGVLHTTLDDWDWVIRTNLWGVIHGCHFFVPAMAERGSGHVVNVSSVAGYFAAAEMLGYATSKFAVFGLSESLRADLTPRGIGVTTVCPGLIHTGIINKTRFRGTADTESARGRLEQLYRRRRYGPDKVARAILDGVHKDRAVVPVAPEAWGLYWMKRFVPAAGPAIGRLIGRSAGM